MLNRPDYRGLSAQLATLCGAAILLGSSAIGFAFMPEETPDNGTYDLVQYHGAESDIIDYDLTASDCRGFAIYHARNGHNVACEPAAR